MLLTMEAHAHERAHESSIPAHILHAEAVILYKGLQEVGLGKGCIQCSQHSSSNCTGMRLSCPGSTHSQQQHCICVSHLACIGLGGHRMSDGDLNCSDSVAHSWQSAIH